jgi:hypothetical protein
VIAFVWVKEGLLTEINGQVSQAGKQKRTNAYAHPVRPYNHHHQPNPAPIHPPSPPPPNQKAVSFLPEPDLAREVFRVYLGEPPVSQDAKECLASEVPALLKEHHEGERK